MFNKIVLCASPTQLTIGLWKFRRLSTYQVLENNESGYQEFKNFLLRFPNTPIYLIVDAIEEDYRLEHLPHTSGNTRKELLHRKLQQIYRGIEFKAAQFINRDKEKRKDDRYLFSALNNPSSFSEWLSIINSADQPLAGVYLLPLLSQALSKRMKLNMGHLLLSEKLHSGLRQSYIEDGQLRMSRLAPIPEDMESKLGYFYHLETEKTRLYLISQRFITRETHINIAIPSFNGADASFTGKALEQEYGIKTTFVDLAAIAKGLGLDPKLAILNPELIHMQLLANGNVPASLAPSELIKNYQLNSLVQSINVLSVIIVIVGLLYAFMNTYQSINKISEIDQLIQERHLQENLYTTAASNFPDSPIPSADLKTSADVHETILSNYKTPLRLMQIISNGLTEYPELQINKLRWTQSSDVNLKDDDKSPLSNNKSTVADTSTTPFQAIPNTWYEIGFVSGELKGFSGDYRAALASVNHFVETLKSNKSVAQVSILQAPVNVSSYTNLQGSTNDEQASQQQAALFKIKLVLKREEPAAK